MKWAAFWMLAMAFCTIVSVFLRFGKDAGCIAVGTYAFLIWMSEYVVRRVKGA